MHFNTPLAVAALATVAQAVSVQVVSVGQNPMNVTNQTVLQYFPNNIVAEAGSMVQFQFLAGNHTVTQSNFDNPCVPLSQVNSSEAGIRSGYMPVTAGASGSGIPVFTIMINNTAPMWLFCSQVGHCGKGMAMVINQNTTANSSRSLENYISAAAALASASNSSSNSSSGPSASGSLSSSNSSSANATGANATDVAINDASSISGISSSLLFALGGLSVFALL